ncbi:MAG: elongation factor G [Planctomyces sp.]|nr:elongation factor G [Planctomyces sp.]MBA4039932.1 elongation factor G [Planctomyces sp.]
MGRFAAADVRNLVVVGHNACGKTTLLERFLYHTHATAKLGSTTDGSSVIDCDPEEKTHAHTISAKPVHFVHAGRLINAIDTPGSADLFGQVVTSLPPVETALVVIDATRGIEVTTRRAMRLATELGLPRMIVVNKIDHDGLDAAALLTSLRDAFGPECLAINLPVRSGTDVIDVFDHATTQAGTAPDQGALSVPDAHRAIVEQVVEMDEELTGEYFDHGDHLDPAKLRRAFESAMRAGHLVPVCFASARTGAGIDDLLHVIADLCPTPEHETPPALRQRDAAGATRIFDPPLSAAAPAVAHVFKIVHDPYMGKLAHLRVIQGTLRPKDELYLNDADKKPLRLGHLFKVRGKDATEVDTLGPGDLGCVAKVDELRHNAILHADPALHLLHPDLPLPRPVYGLAVELNNHADETKFTAAIHKLTDEDPCLVMDRVAATGQTVLRGLGELHLRLTLEKLKARFHLDLTTHQPKVAFKEAITAHADGHHRHKKQTGGAGQFGEVFLRVSPLSNGHADSFEFLNATVGGSVPRQFMPAIEKGCRQAMASGCLAGFPLTAVRVEVYDGKHHDVDSKEIAFVTAGRKAFIDAVLKAKPVLLEPWVALEISAPASSLGDLTADLSSKRGRVLSSDILPGDQCLLRATAPLSELGNYAGQLKSITAGQGAFSMEYSHDEKSPPNVQQALVAAYRPTPDDE